MGDILGISASIIAILQLSVAVVGYVGALQDSSQTRSRLQSQLSSAIRFLFLLKDLIARSKK